ncbi:ABC1 family protein, putative [Babesia ovis]|uniref:ABC1 family protein, putative n=1 Tax=Babesia ovis TaxID=5869 RepID=A0A9W5T8F9_BABOV|nr:ABC1 family protein, putative [Babesia ovis]
MASQTSPVRNVDGIPRTESVKSDHGETGRTPLQRSMDVFWAISNLTVEWNKKLVMGTFVSAANKQQYWKEAHQSMAQLIVENIRSLKGCWVKVGQILSTKPGMLPRCYIDAFSQLQDRVGHSDFAEIIDIIEEEIGFMDEVFNNFDSIPLASASIAQVHKAKLHDGYPVAIKVQHKCSEQNMRNDLEILKMILSVAQSVGQYERMFASIDDYTAAAMREVDFNAEAENCKKAAIDAQVSGIPIRIPKIFDKYCSKRVVTMELFQLYKMTDIDFFKKHNIDEAAIVYDIHDFAIFQILSGGSFHGDPHPGNLLLTQDPDGRFYPVLIDWGMTQSLSTKQRVGLCNLTFALCMADTIGCLTGFIEAGFDMSTHKTFCYEQFLESLVNIFASDFSKVLDVCAEEGSANLMSEDSIPGEWHYNGRMFMREFITNAPNFFPILLKVVSEYRNYAIMLHTQVPLMQILYKNAGNALYNMYNTPLAHMMSSDANKSRLMRKIRRLKQLMVNDCVDVSERQLLSYLFGQFSTDQATESKLTGYARFGRPRNNLEAKLSALLDYVSRDSSLLVAAQIAVIRDGSIEVDLSHGFMGKYECRPINSTALFQISNLMNGLIVTAVLNLTEKYEVNLDDPICKHWPEFGQNGKDVITIREMLNHSSGLVIPYPNILLVENLDYDTMVEDLANAQLHKEMLGQTHYAYLYFGWIMAEVVRRVSGKSVEEYILNMAASVKVPLKQFIFPCLDIDVDSFVPDTHNALVNQKSMEYSDEDIDDKPANAQNSRSLEYRIRRYRQSKRNTESKSSDDILLQVASGESRKLGSKDNVDLNDAITDSTMLLDITFDRPGNDSAGEAVDNIGDPDPLDDTTPLNATAYNAPFKARAMGLVKLGGDDSTYGNSMETLLINGRQIDTSRIPLSTGNSSDNLTTDYIDSGVNSTELDQSSMDDKTETTLEVKDILMSGEEFDALGNVPEAMPAPSDNIALAKALPPESRRAYVNRVLKCFEMGGAAAVNSAPVHCLCGVKSDNDEEFYQRCFSPSEECPLETRLVRHARLPLKDLDEIDIIEAEKILNEQTDRGTKKRYHPILVSEEHVISNDDELQGLDLIKDDTVLSRTRLRKFIVKRPNKTPVFDYCTYDVINHRCIITDPLTMDYPSMYTKSIPCLNGRATAMALSKFYKAVLDNSLVTSDLIEEAQRTVSLDKSVVTKMMTGLYTPVWGLGYQLFYLRRKGNREMLVGLGTVDVSGSLNLMVPGTNLVVTVLFSSGDSVPLSHQVLKVILGHYGLELLYTNSNVGDPQVLYRLLATINV